jgi:hypothetical protein
VAKEIHLRILKRGIEKYEKDLSKEKFSVCRYLEIKSHCGKLQNQERLWEVFQKNTSDNVRFIEELFFIEELLREIRWH